MKIQDIILSLCILIIVILSASCGPKTTLDDQPQANGTFFAKDSQTYLLKDTTVKVLWHTKNSTPVFNSDYLDTMSDPEKAAVGFVSAFIKTNTGLNINCSNGGAKLKPLLLFEQKSNEKKLSFLKQWFRYDKYCLKKLENPSAFCITQKEFEEMNLSVTSDTITVLFTAKETIHGETKRWKQQDTFRLDQNNLLLIEERQSEIN